MNSIKTITFLDHTADAKFQAFGNSLEEAFINAGIGMFELLTSDKVQPKIKHKIKIESSSKEALLFDFLDELIFLLDTEGFIASEIEMFEILTSNAGFIIQTTVKGDYFKKYDVHCDIKAVTYNEMVIDEEYNQSKSKIKDKQQGWKVMVQVVLDI